jgi:hypothetical protein
MKLMAFLINATHESVGYTPTNLLTRFNSDIITSINNALAQFSFEHVSIRMWPFVTYVVRGLAG